jgi:hypothetical protein
MIDPSLCSTCVHAQDCMYHNDVDTPIWECQEYERYEPSVQPSLKAVRSSSQKRNIYQDDSVVCKGLCQTCAYREVCTYPHPEAGVWHCEEYR